MSKRKEKKMALLKHNSSQKAKKNFPGHAGELVL
jgi:hypothetical protein